MVIEMTTIAIDVKVRAKLEKLKVHPKEPSNDVIKRLLESYEKCGGNNGDKKK